METNNDKLEQMIKNIGSAMEVIKRMDIWLPEAIDRSLNGNSGTLNRSDIDKIRSNKRDEELHNVEMNSLRNQIEDSQKQTREIAKQTRYIMWGFIITAISTLISAIIQIYELF